MQFILIGTILLVIVFGPGLWVKHVLARYSTPEDRYKGTGAQLARWLLDKHDMQHVRVEQTETGDHYDPNDKAVQLTPEKYGGRSMLPLKRPFFRCRCWPQSPGVNSGHRRSPS